MVRRSGIIGCQQVLACIAPSGEAFLFDILPRVSMEAVENKPQGSGAQGDDLRTFLSDFVACLPPVEFPCWIQLAHALEPA